MEYTALFLTEELLPDAGSFAPGYGSFGASSYGPPQSAGPAYGAPQQQGYGPGQPGTYGSYDYPSQYGSYVDQYGQGLYGSNQYRGQPSYMPQQPQMHYGPPQPPGVQGAAPATDAYLGGGQSSGRGGPGRMQRGGRGRPPQ